ncbi:MAG: hypothetical protein BGO26_11145 [Actinobacteria bacterium 69-20]|nr:MAG: hypothetical protein BGO26_11145 [Actinobacteria bacterium 69-20]
MPPAELGPEQFADALPELIDIYATAMHYSAQTCRARMPLWLDHSRRAGFRCVVTLAASIGTTEYDDVRAAPAAAGRFSPAAPPATHPDGHAAAAGTANGDEKLGGAGASASTTGAPEIAGFAYGYLGAPGQWWHGEVARGLGHRTDPPSPRAYFEDYFELTELHVRPAYQGRGLGEELLRTLLAPVTARAVLLSTPEGESRAWRLYRRLDFVDVLRDFRFTGDARPFAVLGRALPIGPEMRTASYSPAHVG